MGGGKSRALCEEVFNWMIDCPGVIVPVFRNVHTHIATSTRRTFLEQVLPSELRGRKDLVRVVESQGKDFVEFLWNGSTVHFVGLDNPGRWFSTEIGAAAFDEAHEIDEKAVSLVNSRLRQRCASCVKNARPEDDCDHMPHRIILTFNPSFPGHWLQQWFILGAQRTEYGYRKDSLSVTDSDGSLGDAEFFISLATQNPYLPKRYIERNLASFSKLEKARYLDGIWAHGGNSFFDEDALNRLTGWAAEVRPVIQNAEPAGDLTGADASNPPTIRARGGGRMEVYRNPVRWHVQEDGVEVKDHRYIVAVDASSGTSSDYSAIQVVSIEDLEQVAEWQGKVDPDQLAELAFLTACVYNGATLAPEITGGWGFAVTKRLQKMLADWRGPARAQPRLYTRPIIDRISNRWTDLLGWDTNTKTRALMLDTLEQSARDGSLVINGARTLAEMAAFANIRRSDDSYSSPRAQKGAHDDLVIALAIAVTVATKQPRKQTVQQQPAYEPMFGATGY